MQEGVRLDQVSIVLHKTKQPENIGSAARAACNMGIDKLVLVSPENPDHDRMSTLATHAAAHLVDQCRIYADLQAALAPFNFVIGTTARLGGQRSSVVSPAEAARRLVPISQENRVALLFGPEDRGLTNEELRLCHLLVNIPTAGFASLNLAQAVMVMCYEVYKTGAPSHVPDAGSTPRLASRIELDGMYDQLKDILVRINYIQPENPDYWMHKLRRFFNRLQLQAGEVSIIRGICRQIDWYARKCYEDGRRNDNPPPVA